MPKSLSFYFLLHCCVGITDLTINVLSSLNLENMRDHWHFLWDKTKVMFH